MKTRNLMKMRDTFLGLSMMLVLTVSCTKDEEVTTLEDTEVTATETEKNILEFISERKDATIFNELIETSSPEVKNLFNGDEEYTIFVPTNQAWETFFTRFLGYDSVDDLTIDKRRDLRDLIVKYHTVQGSFLKESFVDAQKVESLEGQPFQTFVSGDNIFLEDNTNNEFNDYEDGTTVIEADGIVSNGVVHFIDAVLIPENFIQTLARKILERDDTTIFEEALVKTDLFVFYRDITRADAFIPNDEAWETCFNLLGDNFNSLNDFETEEELTLLKEIVLNHVTKGVGPDGFSAFTELNDIDVRLIMRDGFGNMAFGLKDGTGLVTQFEETNIAAENKSNLHIIDRVLLPQSIIDYVIENYKDSLMDFITNLDDLKSLHEAFTAVPADKLPSFLKNGTPFTLFLPTEEALTALENQYGDLDTQKGREILANIIGYHFIYGQKINASDISFSEPYKTFQYETISFEQVNGGVAIIDSKGDNSATVLSVDNDIAGGTVHVIDSVLIPAELAFYE